MFRTYVIGRLARAGRLRFGLAAVTVAALGGSLLAVPPALAAPAEAEHLKPQTEVLDKDGKEVAGKGWPAGTRTDVALPEPVWPAAGTAIAVQPVATQRTAASKAAAAGATAVVVDRAAVPEQLRAGVVAKVSATATGPASVVMNYSKFRNAYGSDWASRLRLWQVPDCALTTPQADGCAATPLPSRNDGATSTVTGDVSLKASGTATVALMAGPSGPAGDFGASPLAASSSWSAGGATGDFSWSYPLRAPSGINGPVPTMSLSYSSSSVDGRSSATNNQPSWIGEGFEFAPGYVERRYVSCDDDKAKDDKDRSPNNPAHSFDQCWRSNNAVLSFGSVSSELVFEDGKGWHGRSENGAKIEQSTGAGNDDDNGEYWKVTTSDGIQYFFGLNTLPGQTSKTESAWTAPVYGNHPDEPCHGDTFAASDCNQAWRWNLDYAIDPHGNTISYWYGREKNRYAAQGSNTNLVTYDRGGALERIDYGTWSRSDSRSVTPLAQVNFVPDNRCLANCSDHESGNAWPDTPWDQECKSTATTCTNYSPTFWSTKRLKEISTQIRSTTSAAWQKVDSWTLTHSFPSPGDGTKGGLWLDKIVHTGLVGGEIPMPPVTFDPVALQNRVLTKTGTTNSWQRIGNIHTETGALIQVTYSPRECNSNSLPAPESNNRLCYPVKGPDPLSTSGGDITEWWHKYVVKRVAETDVQLESGHQSPTRNTTYEYEGDPAWHFSDDDGLGKAKYRTWDQFRGYASVLARVGDTNQTLMRTRYFRGMHGDRANADGTTRRTVTVPASVGSETVYDEDQFAGMIREQVTYNGTEDKPVSKTVNVPWRSPATATRTIGKDTVTARFVNVGKTYAGTALGVNGARGWRVTSTETTYDNTYGMVTEAQDNGDVSVTGDEKCTTTSYNRNPLKNLIALPRRVVTTALACGVAATKEEHVVDDAVTYYDNADSSVETPQWGDLTRTDLLKSWTAAGGSAWITSGRSTVDLFGRQKVTTDVRGNTVTNVYSPDNGLVTLKTQTTNLNWITKTEINPAWSAPTKVTDYNNRVTETQYDALGRIWKVWDPGWTRKTTSTPPKAQYTYAFDADRKSYPYVRTDALNSAGGTDTSYVIYDGLLRSRQTQKAAVGEGRVVSDTLYDQYGNAYMSFGAHAEPGNASGSLWWEPEWSVPAQTQTVFDRAGRATANVFLSGDGDINIVEKWRTTTTYEGDRATVVPPRGGTPSTTLLDGLGRTSELRQYTTASGVSGAYDSTKYEYNSKDALIRVEDAAKDEWTYKYDLLGRQIEAVDPDRGKTTSKYNDYGDLTSTIDALNQTLVYTYDGLGRKKAVYDTAETEANKRAEWTYDALYSGAPAKGQLTQATRYDIASDGTRQPFKWQVRAINARNQVTGDHYIIPPAEAGLAGTYVYSHGYSDYTGAPISQGYPEAGGLPIETVTTGYDAVSGLPNRLLTNLTDVDTYVVGQQYTGYGEPTITTMEIDEGVYAEQAVSYELDTRRIHEASIKPETATGKVAMSTYQYDPSGQIERINETPEVGTGETQCFVYDKLRRLTSAWTPKADPDCSDAPTAANLGGPAPYWTDWTFDKLGNRTDEVSHTAAGDTKRKYAVPTAGLNVKRPHAVTGMTTTRPDQSSTTVGYTYDDTGNMKTRPGATGTQTLTWNSEGRVTQIAEGTKRTTNVYDADGGRLIRRDSTGSTLFLPGMEVIRKSTGAMDATRYYSFAGSTVASRTTAEKSLTWLFTDYQGTQQVAVNAYSQQVSIRRQTPYGGPRGTNPAWPNGKGFVGGDLDASGLTHLGAREYDPELGRFISVDPLQDLMDPQQWNAYAYGGNNPINNADPTGLMYPVSERGDTNQTPCYDACQEQAKAGNSQNNSNANAGSGGQGGGSGSGSSGDSRPAKPKKKPWWKSGADWVAEHKNDIIAVGVGVGVGVGCTALTGGGGALFCMGLAGAAGNMTGDYLDGNMHSAQDVADSFVDGAVAGFTAVPMAAINFGNEGSAAIDSAVNGDYAGAANHGALAALDATTVATAGAAGGVKGLGKRTGCKNSFSPETLVLMADGSTKPIRDIEVGDRVVATDPETGKTTIQLVEALHDNLDHDLVNLTVTLPDGTKSVIHTTANHPFWDETSQSWTDAASLRAGHSLRTPAGDQVTVKSVVVLLAARHMFNVTVADVHTYYVIVSDLPVLVHNCGTNPDNRAGLAFTDAGRDEVYAANAAKNGGSLLCEYCARGVTRRPSVSGVRGRADDAQIDHRIPKSCGGCGDPHNGAVACRACNNHKSNKDMAKWDAELREFLPYELMDARHLNLIRL
ncbi:HNH endonuclease [Actinoplanes sp. LDG1-06]|uniref:HNH endonuclease n=1 Tax=Paractinoplanes ovalisporus TaxID=2810368 RepID=A0ABS2A7I3_9ACTN|nr:polymorphic toxin-type HINT domain-containing protein [Actinoplanes ovalisporus]MBM2615793.1 HNH endonuclease [Actinoplanes ovalisporus]